jgi:hypothetical protein
MTELTAALRAELQRMRAESHGSEAPIRVTRRQDGTLALGFDEVRAGDVSLVPGASGARAGDVSLAAGSPGVRAGDV